MFVFELVFKFHALGIWLLMLLLLRAVYVDASL